MVRRVVITGCGVISSIGNSLDEVAESLRLNRSGIEFVPEYKALGYASHVAGTIKGLGTADEIRKPFGPKARFMDMSALYGLLACEQALADAGLTAENLQDERVGCLLGSSFSNSDPYKQIFDRLGKRQHDVSAFDIARALTNTMTANFSYYYGIKGRSYSIGSACATATHNIGHAFECIRHGVSDMMVAGGAEEVTPALTGMFEGMRRALSKKHNKTPSSASRPYDKSRDGFVISGGAGIVILEEYERAVARGAKIYGEITGFGATADGHDIIAPDPTGNGNLRCMSEALTQSGLAPSEIDYVNTHGTSTPKGDVVEVKSITKLFGEHPVKISSTKALTGHGIGAAGGLELIFCLLMMQENFVTASAHIENLDDELANANIVRENLSSKLNHILSNSFGFGGTNASLIVSRCD
ncbi:beta-ketoacyl-[acyl-carrier-protein] synthase family protein [Alteromonas sp. a30]|uniref:beta-ketoacyl-[acyl-carrier-protein] synthase family protein n=1 Tax=Alteromonas sp. a30 TaxID=2730917 RepID=UPI00227F3BE0|nr:beta-ketoacyl-[acyl-carrier-protein] synthase family protein [Alteromonas sp. a30]MCY7296478.1 beta-ketoacyl-[acyl-carrier-protein] synthase family protein [Alteromonas sp. a30]